MLWPTMFDVRGVEQSRAKTFAAQYAWLAVVSGLLAMSVLLSVAIFQNQSIPNSRFMDFTVFWTAAHFDGDVYDVVSLTAAQVAHLPSRSELRPFSYPPSTLLLLMPLRLFPYDAALLLWTVAGVAAFAAGAVALGRRAILGLALLPVGMALLAGQISLLLAGALSGATALLAKNEAAAGILFGLVAAVKPQIAVLVPVALIVGGHWRAIIYSAATFILVLLASLSLGPHLWMDWLHGLPQFVRQTSQPPYRELNIAFGPTFAPLGIALVGIAFRYSRSPSIRLLALTLGTVLTVPYMLMYDLAIGCPALAALLLAPLSAIGARTHNAPSPAAANPAPTKAGHGS